MKLILCFTLLFAPFQTTNSSTLTNTKKQVMLVYGDNLAMLFLISIQPSHNIAIYTIPTNALIPAVCANNHPTAISNITDQSCLKASLSTTYSLDIINTVYIHTNQIEEDFTLSKPAKKCKVFSDLQAYFHELGTQSCASMIWNINSYLKTDISLLDLYTYYQLYIAEDLRIQYYFLHLLQIDPLHMISIDTQFYELKE